MAVSRATAFIRVLVTSVARRVLVPSLLALASLLISAPSAASPHPAGTPVPSTREAPSAACHVYERAHEF
jgi:hypothetical protein